MEAKGMWTWLIRAMVVAAVLVAILEREGRVPTLHDLSAGSS
jgi:hypothetical protein